VLASTAWAVLTGEGGHPRGDPIARQGDPIPRQMER
jgi:hypothetical protein